MPTKYFASTDTHVELRDTMKLQKVSLDEFARRLGYEWRSLGHYVRCCPFRGLIDNHPKGVISLYNMQQWHNNNFTKVFSEQDWHGKPLVGLVTLLLKIPEKCVNLAINSKLVQTTHLQYSKKQRKILCTDHQIQFV